MPSVKTLAEKIKSASGTGDVVETLLKTDQRVLARITDGIYRQPASALRELIANAYDADATQVVIHTDLPRFGSMSIRDNGNGMGVDTLAHVLEHIGGSLKRTPVGAQLDVTSSASTDLSPGGRKLIGKIGIGLFSVAQLTSHFQIITKVKGEAERLIADIVLSPENIEQAIEQRGEDADLKTGSVKIRSVPAEDVESQGTEIVLMDLRPQTRDLLTSRASWAALKPSPENVGDNWMPSVSVEPIFHIGGLDFTNPNLIETPARLPWDRDDSPTSRFKKLVSAVRAQTTSTNPKPELASVLDNYLRMVWTLAIALPLPYVGGHPFDIRGDAGLSTFGLSNSPKGQSTEISLKPDEALRDNFTLVCPKEFEDTDFKVQIDGIELMRPIVFARTRETSQAIANDLLFVGANEPNLDGIPEEFRGGRLRFEAYLYWSNRIVPKEHNGVLVRVRGASGTLFDPTFMGYQVSEQTRLKQICAEIFVIDGLEAALNIDRESFNYANIHYQYISRWLHGAIRQLANKHKQISSDALGVRRNANASQKESKLSRITMEEWSVAGRGGESPTEVVFSSSDVEVESLRGGDGLVLNANSVFGPIAADSKRPVVDADTQMRLRAIASILDAYGVFESMDYERQEKLIAAIGRVLIAEGKDAL